MESKPATGTPERQVGTRRPDRGLERVLRIVVGSKEGPQELALTRRRGSRIGYVRIKRDTKQEDKQERSKTSRSIHRSGLVVRSRVCPSPHVWGGAASPSSRV